MTSAKNYLVNDHQPDRRIQGLVDGQSTQNVVVFSNSQGVCNTVEIQIMKQIMKQKFLLYRKSLQDLYAAILPMPLPLRMNLIGTMSKGHIREDKRKLWSEAIDSHVRLVAIE